MTHAELIAPLSVAAISMGNITFAKRKQISYNDAVLERERINGDKSKKEVRHYVLHI